MTTVGEMRQRQAAARRAIEAAEARGDEAEAARLREEFQRWIEHCLGGDEEETAPATQLVQDPATAIPADTLRAYRETEYRVGGEPPLTLRIGEANSALAALHRDHAVEASAFITAWNPFSRVLSEEANAARHDDLVREIEGRGLSFIEGFGAHPSWPGEASLLILGIDREAAKDLGVRFEQNAIVWCGVDALPELVLLR